MASNMYIYKGVRVGGLSPPPPIPPFLRGFRILEEMETPATCEVPRNVLLLLVVWGLRCNNQKKGETKDPPSE